MPFQPFIDHLKFEKRTSAHTVLAYQKDLEQFFGYCLGQYEVKEPAEVSTAMVRSWMADMSEQGLESKSIVRKLSSLRSFYKYLLRTKKIEQSPMSNVVAPKIKKRLPVFVDETRMQNLFVQTNDANGFDGILKKAILELFYATGMRLSELISLQLRDYNGYQVKVIGKRSKERILPLTKPAVEALEKYLEQRRKLEKVIDHQHFFLNKKGNKLYPKFVYQIVNTYLALITTEKKKSPHVLRHTFATHLLNNGAELNAVKELLGHTSLAATQVYTHNTINKLISIHQKAHPLNNRDDH